MGGMYGRGRRLREGEGAETSTHGVGKEGHRSAEYETGCAMYRRGRKHEEGDGWGTAVHDVKDGIAWRHR